METALKDSIRKWERNTYIPMDQVKLGVANCPLCQVHRACKNCPVALKTNQRGCWGSPYTDAEEAFNTYKETKDPEAAKNFRYHAQREVDFLKSLIPKKTYLHFPNALSFVIAPCEETPEETRRCSPEEAKFWGLYYTEPQIEKPTDPLDGIQMSIMDFDSEDDAVEFADKIRDERPLYIYKHPGFYEQLHPKQQQG